MTEREPGRDRILAEYLDDRDADCPSCGYNLRAVSGSVCPECGHALVLSLRNPHPLWGRRGLMALLFCWLVLAGSMNAAREGRTIHASLTAPAPGLALASFLMPTVQPQAVPQPMPLRPLPQGQLVPVGGDTGLNWSAVGWQQWTRLGSWTCLALLAATALVMLFRVRKRIPSRRVVRVLTLFAWIGFGGYFAYHGWSFVALLSAP